MIFIKIAKKLQKISDFFAPLGLSLRSEEDQQNTKIIINASILLFIGNLLTAIFELFTVTTPLSAFVTILLTALSVSVLLLAKRGYPLKVLAYLMVGGATFSIYLGAYSTGGVESQNLLWLLVIPFVATWLMGPTVGYVLAAVISILIYPFFWSEDWQFVNPAGNSRDIGYCLTYVFLLFTVAYFCSRFLQKIARQEELARQSKSQVKYMQKNVNTGFFVVGSDLRIAPGYSDFFRAMFDRSMEHVLLCDLLFTDPARKAIFNEDLAQVFSTEDDALLKRLSDEYLVHEHCYLLSGVFVHGMTKPRIMFTIEDISKQVQVKREAWLKEITINLLRYKQRFLAMQSKVKNLSDPSLTFSRQKMTEKLISLGEDVEFFQLKELAKKIDDYLILDEIPHECGGDIADWLKRFINSQDALRDLASEDPQTQNWALKIESGVFDSFVNMLQKVQPDKKEQVIRKFLDQVEKMDGQ